MNIIVVKNPKGIIVLAGEPGNYSIKSDNPQLLKEVRQGIKAKSRVPLIPGRNEQLFTAGDTSLVELLAGMMCPDPHLSTIVEAPKSLIDSLLNISN